MMPSSGDTLIVLRGESQRATVTWT